MNGASQWRWPQQFKDADFVRRVLIVIGLGALALLAWKLSDVVLLTFGAVLVAVVLRAFADVLTRWTPLPERRRDGQASRRPSKSRVSRRSTWLREARPGRRSARRHGGRG